MEKDDVKELLSKIKDTKYDAVVIGSGFGGAVAITKLAENNKKVLVLERGTWWGNPEGPGLPGKKFGIKYGKENKQWWPRPNSSQGMRYVLESIYKEKGLDQDILDILKSWYEEARRSGIINAFLSSFRTPIKDIDLGLRKNRKGLYRVTRFSHKNGNVDVISGNGVGGGSLFYSGVNLIPHKPVLIRNKLDHLKGEDFKKAIEWMEKYRGRINKINTRVPVPHREGNKFQLTEIPGSNDTWQTSDKHEMPDPILADHEDDYLHLDRARVLKRALEQVKQDGGFNDSAEIVSDFKPLPLSIVEFDPKEGGDSDKKNAFCLRESRCLFGCLPSARHTLYKTLLKLMDKVNTDNKDMITVVPQTKVTHIDRGEDGNYDIHFTTYLHNDDEKLRGSASAKKVFVAAGCLGTTEIMLRSKKRHKPGSKEGLPLNDWVGKRFSTNGDLATFVRNVKDKKNATEKERLGNVNPTVGPINSSGFHLAFDKNTDQRIDVHVEDCGLPTLGAYLLYEIIPVFKKPHALKENVLKVVLNMFANLDKPDTKAREQASFQTERELISDLYFLLTIGAGPDEPLGSFKLDEDEDLQLEYLDDKKKLGDWEVFKKCEAVMKKLSEKMNGEFVKLPWWDSEEKRVSVVHPLGGCPIGKDSNNGAVDQLGRVFNKEGGILKGLYVVDAAAIPGALAVNPTLTIVTQAVKCVENALEE